MKWQARYRATDAESRNPLCGKCKAPKATGQNKTYIPTDTRAHICNCAQLQAACAHVTRTHLNQNKHNCVKLLQPCGRKGPHTLFTQDTLPTRAAAVHVHSRSRIFTTNREEETCQQHLDVYIPTQTQTRTRNTVVVVMSAQKDVQLISHLNLCRIIVSKL